MTNSKDTYYSIAIVRGRGKKQEVLYRMRALFSSFRSAQIYLEDAMLDPKIAKVQKVRVEIVS